MTVLLLLPVLALSGCAAVVVGGAAAAGAGYLWFNGNLEHTLDSALPKVEVATRQALEGLDLVGIETRADKLKGRVTARMADGTKVTVKLKAMDFETTSVRIRVGTFGDQAISEQILRHIERRL